MIGWLKGIELIILDIKVLHFRLFLFQSVKSFIKTVI